MGFKMKLIFVLFCIVYVSAQEKFYDRKYDYYDIDHLIQNQRLLKKYISCFLDRGPCTPVGRVFKVILPEVVVSACAKCSPSQKSLARRTFEAFNRYLPVEHQELKKKLDPDNKYFNAFQTAISKV